MRQSRASFLSALFAAAALALMLVAASSASATAPITGAADALRTGWYPDQTSLNSDLVTGGTFGRLFSTGVTGQVYAQPLLASDTLFVATEDNWIYGMNPRTGAVKWSRSVGTPFNSSDIPCGDLTPHIGITGTPVIDPDTNTAYFFDKTYVSGAATWFMHAVDVNSGTEKTGFPVKITGNADNDSSVSFDPKIELQRPGLLLMNGVVYAGFGGHCDAGNYRGWVIGVSTSGTITARWASAANGVVGAGIWHSGSGLVSDGNGRIILATGNGGAPTGPISGSTPPASLGEAVVRLGVQPNGTLRAADFFAPYDAATLDTWDADLGSGGPVGLPSAYFGTSSVPNLMVEVGKQGYVYLLDRSNLGGIGNGPSGADRVVGRIGPYGGVWSRPAVWPGDGGYIYIPSASGGTSASGSSGNLNVFHYGVNGSGTPTLSKVAASSDAFGFTSSAAVVTSNATTSGSALVWMVWAPNGGGSGAQLRAYSPVPSGGVPHLLWSAPVGTSSKFTPPGVGANKLFVGTRDGHVLGFGAPVDAVLTSSPVTFPSTTTGSSSQRNAVFTATRNVTVSSVGTTGAPFSAGTPTPATGTLLHNGDTFTVPVTFSPTASGTVAGSVQLGTSEGQITAGLSGNGQPPNGELTLSPPVVSFGGTAVGGDLTGTVTISNTGGSPLTINSVGSPSAPFSVTGAPANGSSLAAGHSVTVDVAFDPTAPGSFTDELDVNTSAGDGSVGLSGNATTAGHLELNPPAISNWYVKVGDVGTTTFQVSNTGGTAVTITKSKPPIIGSLTASPDIGEGTGVDPGASVTGGLQFAPTSPGPVSAQWNLTGNDDTGPHVITINAAGVDIHSAASVPANSNTGDLNIAYSAADNSGPGLSAVELWVQVPGDTHFQHVWTTTPSDTTGSLHYVAQAGNGVYRFRTAARDTAGLYEGGAAGGEADVNVNVNLTPAFRKGVALPAITSLLMDPASFSLHPARGRGGATVRLNLSAPVLVRFTVERRSPRGHYSIVRGSWQRTARSGSNAFHYAGTMNGRPLRPGLYKLVATPVANDGFAGVAKSFRFRVLSR